MKTNDPDVPSALPLAGLNHSSTCAVGREHANFESEDGELPF
jgi:hypothetical protein